MEQHVVVTLTINTHAGQVQAGHVLMRNAIAGPFTAPIVLIPQHADPGALNNIQQSLLMGGQHIIIVGARHVGEHAGHGNRRRRSARGGVREIDHIIFGQ